MRLLNIAAALRIESCKMEQIVSPICCVKDKAGVLCDCMISKVEEKYE